MSIQDKIGSDLSQRLSRALTKARAAEHRAAASGDKKPASEGKKSQYSKPEGRKAPNVVEIHSEAADSEAPNGMPIERWPLPGLAPMTRVRTSFGDVHSIALRNGDEVLTKGGEFLPILWLNRIKLESHILNTKPDSNPIVIGPGSFGNSGELMVSPRQVICADKVSGLAESREAATLVSHAGVRRLRETGLTYTMFHVGREAEVYCEGLFLSFPMEA